jgi:hypothetical protein
VIIVQVQRVQVLKLDKRRVQRSREKIVTEFQVSKRGNLGNDLETIVGELVRCLRSN